VRVEADRVEVEAALGDERRQAAERVRERRGVGIGADEDERAPDVDGDRRERDARRVEAGLALRARGSAQAAVEGYVQAW
jgi:hypothetical protein